MSRGLLTNASSVAYLFIQNRGIPQNTIEVRSSQAIENQKVREVEEDRNRDISSPKILLGLRGFPLLGQQFQFQLSPRRLQRHHCPMTDSWKLAICIKDTAPFYLSLCKLWIESVACREARIWPCDFNDCVLQEYQRWPTALHTPCFAATADSRRSPCAARSRQREGRRLFMAFHEKVSFLDTMLSVLRFFERQVYSTILHQLCFVQWCSLLVVLFLFACQLVSRLDGSFGWGVKMGMTSTARPDRFGWGMTTFLFSLTLLEVIRFHVEEP